ncbi:MAG: hypothetical protein M3R17_02155 [Bacteroidota bacterium]|nr:hypothetical protein [Bacteroidota bacterium]
MRFRCGPHLSILLLSLLSSVVAAQVSSDTVPLQLGSGIIPEGVIIVQRPSVKAAFRVQKNVLSELPNVGERQVFSDSVSTSENPPYPIYVEGRQFSWDAVLKQTKYEFTWSDSTRADSARFIYTIDKNGKAKCESFPYENADSSGLAFQTQIFNYFVLFDRWTPARTPKRSNKGGQSVKTKRMACTVIIMVYAYDPNVGRLVPMGPER